MKSFIPCDPQLPSNPKTKQKKEKKNVSQQKLITKTKLNDEWVILFLLLYTDSERAEHFAQSIRELRVAFVQLEVDFTQVWRAIHADLYERSARAATATAIACCFCCFVRSGLLR